MTAWLRKNWPVVVWAICIFVFSTKYFSSSITGSVIIPLLHHLFPRASLPTLLLVHQIIRKCAHFVEYFIFGLLLFRSLRHEGRSTLLKWCLLAIVIAAAYAVTDELHQALVPGRGPALHDVLLDTFGAAVAQLLAVWRMHHRRSDGSGGLPAASPAELAD